MRRFLARRAAAALRNLPEFVPPLEFPCRIERLPEGCSTIDNELYDDAHYSSTWHAEDTSRELATLQLLNAARIVLSAETIAVSCFAIKACRGSLTPCGQPWYFSATAPISAMLEDLRHS